MAAPDEASTWRRAAHGDGEAFGQVYDAHHQRVYRHALRIVLDRHDAEDVLAAAFLELWRKRASVRVVDGSVLPWLLATATNVGHNHGRTRRRAAVITAAAVGAFGIGGATAIATLRPAADVATAPLSAPVILNGVGRADVKLPAAPQDATYLRIELICFDGTRCHTPGGGIDGPEGAVKIEPDAIPLTDAADADNAQELKPFDPTLGFEVDVNAGTHWRLCAVYTDQLNPTAATAKDGRLLGIPSNNAQPELVPAVATNGERAWVDHHELTDAARPRLTSTGVSQAPLPAYDDDGTTVIGSVDVSRRHS